MPSTQRGLTQAGARPTAQHAARVRRTSAADERPLPGIPQQAPAICAPGLRCWVGQKTRMTQTSSRFVMSTSLLSPGS